MSISHRYFLSLGSNIRPASSLAEAVRRLQDHGEVGATSGTWESHAIGSSGPDFLNICVEFLTWRPPHELKQEVTNRIESEMGRVRSSDPGAPRTIDIDILMVDDRPLNVERWIHPFVLLPLAELLPEYPHPTEHIRLSAAARKAEGRTWIVRRTTRIPRQDSRREP
jgi:2-amino-4-hydroxy-6-hydroxymethyldihydropteridine diphosphokinase